MNIFLPIIMSVVVNFFPGYTFANAGDTCHLTDTRNGIVTTITADDEGWCDYQVEAGVTYTMTVGEFSETFTAVDHAEEYNVMP